MARHIILKKLDNISATAVASKLNRLVVSSLATVDNQKTFTIPMQNFDKSVHLFDVRIGSTWFSDERYDIINNTIVLKQDEEGIQKGRKVSFVFTYLSFEDSDSNGVALNE